MLVTCVVVAILVAQFFLLPVALTPNNYICHGGFACVHTISLSCVVFGFGTYTVYSGRYFLTNHCPT